MKKIMYYAFISTMLLSSLVMAGCDDDDDKVKGDDDKNDNKNENVIEGPSSDDKSVIPTDASFLGDSIQTMKTFSLSTYPIQEVEVSTTQNGHISVLGGYKEQSAVYVYAKAEDDKNLSNEQIKNILEKYYSVESYADNTKILVAIKEKSGVAHGSDFRTLRISVNVFTPQYVSTLLNIARGSIIVKNVHGNQHKATSTSGTIKYINSSGKNVTANLENGFVGLINTTASQAINSQIKKGNILIALAKDTKADLYLQSTTKVNAYILNNSSFQGSNTMKKVEGKLNGGGYEINASSGLGVINLKWYEQGGYY